MVGMGTEESESTVRAVLFDFGGVLAEEGFREGLQALAREQGLEPDQLPRAGMDAVYDSGFVLGKGTAADFWNLLQRRVGLSGEHQELTERILDGFVIRPWMMDVVRGLRAAGCVTGILSDQTHWLDELDKRTPFKQNFDRVYNSYYLGKGKRDPSLFHDVIEDLGLAAQQVLFVDDDARNIAHAREQGLQTIQYRDQDQFLSALAQRVPH